MKENPYKRLLPLERRPDGTPYRRNAGSGDLPGQGLETLSALVQRSKAIVCLYPAAGGVIPEKRVGGRVRAYLPVLSHL